MPPLRIWWCLVGRWRYSRIGSRSALSLWCIGNTRCFAVMRVPRLHLRWRFSAYAHRALTTDAGPGTCQAFENFISAPTRTALSGAHTSAKAQHSPLSVIKQTSDKTDPQGSCVGLEFKASLEKSLNFINVM